MTKCEYIELSEQQIKAAMEELPGWKIREGFLEISYKLPNFRTAVALLTLVSIEAETLNHHPEWSGSYRTINFSLTTHAAGNKITNLDIELARYITETASNFLKSF